MPTHIFVEVTDLGFDFRVCEWEVGDCGCVVDMCDCGCVFLFWRLRRHFDLLFLGCDFVVVEMWLQGRGGVAK